MHGERMTTNRPLVPASFEMTEELLSEIVEKSFAAEVSILRRYAGLPVRGRAGERIDLVLREVSERERKNERKKPKKTEK